MSNRPDSACDPPTPALADYLDGSRPVDAAMPRLDLRRFREPFVCNICVDFFDTPYMLECGHTYCAACILSWLERQRSCPQCRLDIMNRPVPAYAVQQQVTVVRTMIFGHQVAAHTEVEREAQKAFQALYPLARQPRFIQDQEDQVTRCGTCAWELDEDGICPQCQVQYRGAVEGERLDRRGTSSAMVITDSSEFEEEEDDDDRDLEGFVVSDNSMIECSDGSDELDDDDDGGYGQVHSPTLISEGESDENDSDADVQEWPVGYDSNGDSDGVVYLGASEPIDLASSEQSSASSDSSGSDDDDSEDAGAGLRELASASHHTDNGSTSSSSDDSDDDGSSASSSNEQSGSDSEDPMELAKSGGSDDEDGSQSSSSDRASSSGAATSATSSNMMGSADDTSNDEEDIAVAPRKRRARVISDDDDDDDSEDTAGSVQPPPSKRAKDDVVLGRGGGGDRMIQTARCSRGSRGGRGGPNRMKQTARCSRGSRGGKGGPDRRDTARRSRGWSRPR